MHLLDNKLLDLVIDFTRIFQALRNGETPTSTDAIFHNLTQALLRSINGLVCRKGKK